MSDKTVTSLLGRARETVVTVAWSQWATIGGMASSRHNTAWLVDPEALTLVSLTLLEHERRFWDVIRAWIPVGVRLLSVQRIKNLAGAFPRSTNEAVSEFATLAVTEGKDARWKSLALDTAADMPPSRGKEWDSPGDFTAAPALMLRLRLGLGVGLRTDALSYLLAQHPRWLPVRAIAAALGYTEAATRRALDDLAGAQLIHATAEGQPTTYYAEAEPWCGVLGIAAPPKWCGWFEIFALLAELDQWWRSVEAREITEYAAHALLHQRLRDHHTAFAGLIHEGLITPSKKLDAEDLEKLLDWVAGSLT